MIELELWQRGQRIKTFQFEQEVVFIGRDEKNDISIEDRNASRHHARIVYTEDAYELEDLGSLNGTKLNDQPVSHAALKVQDRIRIGAHVFTILNLAPPEQTRVARYKTPHTSQEPTGSFSMTVEKDGVRLLTKPLADQPIFIGRDATCEIQLQHDDVSRQHAKIIHKHGKYYIEDLDSLNGTFIQAEAIHSAKLTPMTEVRIGPFILTMSQSHTQSGQISEQNQCRSCHRNVASFWPKCPFCKEMEATPKTPGFILTLEPLKHTDPALLALSSEDWLELTFETIASEQHFWVSFDEPDFGLHPIGQVPDTAFGCQECFGEFFSAPKQAICPKCSAHLIQPVDLKSLLSGWTSRRATNIQLLDVTPRPGKSPLVRIELTVLQAGVLVRPKATAE